MIVDNLDQAATYAVVYGPAWRLAFEFLQTLNPQTPDGEYPLRGEEVSARVMTYPTRPLDQAVLEAHRRYIDIQMVLSGAEIMRVFPVAGLVVRDPYDAARDVSFYQAPVECPVRLAMGPGRFAVFFPQDAHMPCLMAGAAVQTVKKVVIKLAVASGHSGAAR